VPNLGSVEGPWVANCFCQIQPPGFGHKCVLARFGGCGTATIR
jgi:hypothetical protein